MSKFLAVLFLFACGIAVSTGTLILGWGLQPKSWGWIIGLGIFGQSFHHLILERVKKEDE